MEIILQRIYEQNQLEEGYRILVDRLWPRGIKKEVANIDEWMKEIAPSSELRKWFGHDPKRFGEFQNKYIKELSEDIVRFERTTEIKEILKKQNVILLYGAKDKVHNHAVVLRGFLLNS